MDDYPEEALLPDETAIQVITSDGKTVSGITVKSYAQLLELLNRLQEALSKQKNLSLKELFKFSCLRTHKPFLNLMRPRGRILPLSLQ